VTPTVSVLTCATDRRRARVRAAGLNGLDCVEVGRDRVHLCVHFLAGIPDGMTKEYLRVEGGVRVKDIQVVSIRRRPPGDGDDEECLEVTLDRPGDPSAYRICAVELDERGSPTGRPYPGLDQRYACADVSFTVDCASTLDCAPVDDCPPPSRDGPAIDYLVRDYPGFRRLLLDRMALLVPGWTERHVPDLGITLVELLAYAADHLAYAQDAVATEAYLGTARHRISVRRHARLVDYVLGEGCNARTFVVLTIDGAPSYTVPCQELVFLTAFPGAPATGTVLDGNRLPPEAVCFEPVSGAPADERTFWASHNEIAIWTWDDEECCLPTGATQACLVDGPRQDDEAEQGDGGARVLALRPGDLLLLEEVLGPRTGAAADADPTRRHVVRLVRVTPMVDELERQPLLEVEWAPEDALPFALCVSTIGPAPECRPLDGVSVARGNVVLADHGCTVGPEPLDPVPDPPDDDCCEGPCQPGDAVSPVPRYRPGPLRHSPLSMAAPVAARAPASALLAQDPRDAVAQAWLTSVAADMDDEDVVRWEARADLLSSGPEDLYFVAEIDDDGRAHLRLGDDRLGEAPQPGDRFTATYRVGNGTAGNVGAETIVDVARRGPTSEHGVRILARNPLAASGGTDPEPVKAAKLLAPTAFRSRLERAVVAEDYAALAQRDVTALQAAGAALRWTGSWYEVLVSVDQRGRAKADPAVLDAVAARLERYRRMGHDVAVAPARSVPLSVRLSVCVAAHHLRAEVEAALRAVLSNRVRPGGGLGFFHPDNHRPGGTVAVSAMVAAAQAAEGVESVEVLVLRRLFGPVLPDRPADGVLRLGPQEVARVDSDPVFPDRGTVLLDLRGGR
jgi:hypothetical protein